jgi:hypothetical protein
MLHNLCIYNCLSTLEANLQKALLQLVDYHVNAVLISTSMRMRTHGVMIIYLQFCASAVFQFKTRCEIS